LRWRSFESYTDRIHYRRNRVSQRFTDFLVGDGQSSGNTFNQIAPLDLHLDRLFAGPGRAELDLDGLSGALTDQKIVFPLDVLNDRFVELVTGDSHRSRVDDTR